MSRHALDRLGRLERRELDREQQHLARITAELARVDEEAAALVAGFGHELVLALDLPGGPGLAAAYAAGHRQRRTALLGRREALEAERRAAEAAAHERALGVRTLELAAEELAARARMAEDRAEQKRLDEAALVRHALRTPGPA